MPFETVNLANGAGVEYISAGLITGKDFIETKMDLLASEDRLNKVRFLVYDLTHIDSLDFPFSDFKKLEDADRLVAEINPCLVIALIVQNDLATTLAKMWIERTHEIPWDKSLFKLKSDAYSWVSERVARRSSIIITC